MIKFNYIDISSFSEHDFLKFLPFLSIKEQGYILKYKFFDDRVRKLLGRILIQNYYTKVRTFNWNNFNYSKAGKPFVQNEMKFNISHSGKIVIVVFSKYDIGADIEIMEENDIEEISRYFHLNEILYLKENLFDKSEFYKIWTRKEAFLKAKGVGIVGDLNKHDCKEKIILDEGQNWHIESLNFKKGYACAISQNYPIKNIKIEEITKEELLEHICNEKNIT
jgi:4'-phosphopantetheinyl transferase